MRASVLLALLVALPMATGTAHGQGSPRWEQEVLYEMEVSLDTVRHHLSGTQRLTYTNNSPDTLSHVFYHLYFNAFQPRSMMAERNRHLPDPDTRTTPRIFELSDDEIGYYDVRSLLQDGVPVPFEIYDTVLKVQLVRPLPPASATVLEMRYLAQIPLQTRRSGRTSREGIAYSMAQWYPKLAAYDERGWHADPYVGREFYAPFGTFDVRLDLPAELVVGATGTLQNAEAVGHGYQQDPDRPVRHAPGSRLTWHFRAEDVHDFAWAADPDYLHDRFETDDGITLHLLYEPSVTASWTRLRESLPRLMEVFQRRYGDYLYPQFTVAQGGDGGMEYPMLTLISGYVRPDFERVRSYGSVLGTTAHELAHQWYYGLLASNEADYAWMDEGFANYTANEALAELRGEEASHTPAVYSLMVAQAEGSYERPNTPSDWFDTNAGYSRGSYTFGEAMLEMLGYVIGEEARDRFLLAYYDRYKLRHPNPYDVEKVAEDVSGIRLDWFFDQLTNTSARYDDEIDELTSVPAGDGGYTTTFTLEREGTLVLPADVLLVFDDETAMGVHVPLSIMQGHKLLPPGWVAAAPWPWTSPEHTVTVWTPRRVRRALLDPFLRTPDHHRLDNQTGFPLRARFLQPAEPTWVEYGVGYRPLVTYAHDFGVGLGVQGRGEYLFGRDRFVATLKIWPRVVVSGGDEPVLRRLPGEASITRRLHWHDGLDYDVSYSNPLGSPARDAALHLRSQKHLGHWSSEVGFEKRWVPYRSPVRRRLGLSLRHTRHLSARAFGTATTLWPVLPCATCPAGVEAEPLLFRYDPFGRSHYLTTHVQAAIEDGDHHARLDLSVGGSVDGRPGPFEGSATRLTVTAQRTLSLAPWLRGLMAVRVGWGADGLAHARSYRLGGVSLDERWRDASFRTLAAPFEEPSRQAHLVAVNGVGPVATLAPEFVPHLPTLGRSALEARLALRLSGLGSGAWVRPLSIDLYTAGGAVSSVPSIKPLFDLVEAGVALHYEVAALAPLRRWSGQSEALAGLHLVAHFPLWVEAPGAFGEAPADLVGFDARWLVGLQFGRD